MRACVRAFNVARGAVCAVLAAADCRCSSIMKKRIRERDHHIPTTTCSSIQFKLARDSRRETRQGRPSLKSEEEKKGRHLEDNPED